MVRLGGVDMCLSLVQARQCEECPGGLSPAENAVVIGHTGRALRVLVMYVMYVCVCVRVCACVRVCVVDRRRWLHQHDGVERQNAACCGTCRILSWQ